MLDLQKEIPMSKYWDHNLSIRDVLKNHEWVYINFSPRSHEISDGFDGCLLYVPHDGEEGFTVIGVFEDGVTYEGDAYFPWDDPIRFNEYNVPAPNEYNAFVSKVEVNKAVDILLLWMNLKITAEEIQRTMPSDVEYNLVFAKFARYTDEYVRKYPKDQKVKQ
jgi:hypothetical protein